MCLKIIVKIQDGSALYQFMGSLFLVLLVASLTDTVVIYHCVTDVEDLIYT